MRIGKCSFFPCFERLRGCYFSLLLVWFSLFFIFFELTSLEMLIGSAFEYHFVFLLDFSSNQIFLDYPWNCCDCCCKLVHNLDLNFHCLRYLGYWWECLLHFYWNRHQLNYDKLQYLHLYYDIYLNWNFDYNYLNLY